MKYLQKMFSKKFLLNLLPILGTLVILSLLAGIYETINMYFIQAKNPMSQLTSMYGYRFVLMTIATHAYMFSLVALAYSYVKKN